MDEVAYMPRILRNMNEICAEMGVHQGIVKLWAEEGAPISVEGTGVRTRYSAEAAALQKWRIRRKGPADGHCKTALEKIQGA